MVVLPKWLDSRVPFRILIAHKKNKNMMNPTQFRKELQKALTTLEEAMGVKINIGTIHYDSREMRVKITALDAAGIKPIKIGNLESLIGRKFRNKNTTFEVLAINNPNSKFPISTVTQKGKRYRVPADFFRNSVEVK